MNELNKKIYELRTSVKQTQADLAKELGVTNKAISKWENGTAIPSTEQIYKLSKIYGVSTDELLSLLFDTSSAKTIHKIVITGGPCSGKSTALSWLQTEFSKKGYLVLFVPESATELIIGGIAPWTIDTNLEFEESIMRLQLQKEAIFESAAKKVKNYNKILIVCDRGGLDCKAYTTPREFAQMLKRLNTNEIQLRDSYDAVFHLVTAAKGAAEFYTLDNNPARVESTLEEAIAVDDATLNAWIGHPHLRVIDNSTNFENKMRRLMGEISSFLGEPAPYEIEKKFLIEYPDIKLLEKLPNCQKVEIIQTYIISPDGELRIRQRGLNGNFVYTKTYKKEVKQSTRIEVEKRISKDEYIKLLLDADTKRRQIRKTRYCLMHENQYFEIDIYPEWKDKAILEIELQNDNQQYSIPKFINVIKEVTNDKEYSNYNLASLK